MEALWIKIVLAVALVFATWFAVDTSDLPTLPKVDPPVMGDPPVPVPEMAPEQSLAEHLADGVKFPIDLSLTDTIEVSRNENPKPSLSGEESGSLDPSPATGSNAPPTISDEPEQGSRDGAS
jgi:hypothetical protein